MITNEFTWALILKMNWFGIPFGGGCFGVGFSAGFGVGGAEGFVAFRADFGVSVSEGFVGVAAGFGVGGAEGFGGLRADFGVSVSEVFVDFPADFGVSEGSLSSAPKRLGLLASSTFASVEIIRFNRQISRKVK